MNDKLEAFRRRLRGPDQTTKVTESRWSGPLVLAIFTAALAAFGNILLAYVNYSAQRDLERAKGEAVLILEMIKTTPEKARVNLQFLVDAGLISEERQIAKLKAYFASTQPEKGPSLPFPVASGTTTRKVVVSCAEIPAKLKKIVSDHLGADMPKVTDNARIKDDLKADELDEVELVMAVEEDFGVQIADNQAKNLKTVGDYIKLLRQRQRPPCK